MVAFTYQTAARLIEAALAVGAAVVDILETIAKASYFVFRKIINAVLQALGPVGDILGWLLDRAEDLASALWREAVLAIRFVKKSVSEILDWASTSSSFPTLASSEKLSIRYHTYEDVRFKDFIRGLLDLHLRPRKLGKIPRPPSIIKSDLSRGRQARRSRSLWKWCAAHWRRELPSRS